MTECQACQATVEQRAARMFELHQVAEAAGYNGAQVVAELNRVVVEQGKDWNKAWLTAMSFYRGDWRDGTAGL